MDSFSDKAFTLYIHPKTEYNDVLDSLETKVDKNTFKRFKRHADFNDYERYIKAGAYKIEPSMSAVHVYKILSRGLQSPVKVTFNNIRTKEQLAKKISEQLMFDSLSIIRILNDTAVINKYGFTRENFISMIIPDTYEFYWTISPDEFIKRMNRSYNSFWNESRKSKVANMGISPVDLSIIASIAEEETNNASERGIVGRLYLNRVQRRMPLQADPTVKYALNDFTLKRILNVHLEVESPYNTYKVAGLPPGPIRIPSKNTLDAILSSEKHPYLYMCAKEDFSGLHNFARTLSEHNANDAKYRAALNKRKIR